MPQKDDKLLQDLVGRYAKLFMKLACNSGVPYDDAEDIAMEAIWSFYQSEYYGTLDERETKMMMARIVKNKSIDFYRKRRRENEETVDKEIEDFYDLSAPGHLEPEKQVIADYNYRRIREVVENLKPTWRDTAIMYFLEGRTHAEISKALGVSEEVCRARVSRARKFLEEELKEYLHG